MTWTTLLLGTVYPLFFLWMTRDTTTTRLRESALAAIAEQRKETTTSLQLIDVQKGPDLDTFRRGYAVLAALAGFLTSPLVAVQLQFGMAVLAWVFARDLALATPKLRVFLPSLRDLRLTPGEGDASGDVDFDLQVQASGDLLRLGATDPRTRHQIAQLVALGGELDEERFEVPLHDDMTRLAIHELCVRLSVLERALPKSDDRLRNAVTKLRSDDGGTLRARLLLRLAMADAALGRTQADLVLRRQGVVLDLDDLPARVDPVVGAALAICLADEGMPRHLDALRRYAGSLAAVFESRLLERTADIDAGGLSIAHDEGGTLSIAAQQHGAVTPLK